MSGVLARSHFKFTQELALLTEFEARDCGLQAKLSKCKSDKAQVVSEIHECNEKLAAKRAELEVWQQKDSLVLQDFLALLPEEHPFHTQLLTIFKRKIKRFQQS